MEERRNHPDQNAGGGRGGNERVPRRTPALHRRQPFRGASAGSPLRNDRRHHIAQTAMINTSSDKGTTRVRTAPDDTSLIGSPPSKNHHTATSIAIAAKSRAR
jgi:hypothetical protein